MLKFHFPFSPRKKKDFIVLAHLKILWSCSVIYLQSEEAHRVRKTRV